MKEENIKNLTSLWALVGNAFNVNQLVDGFQIVNISFSEWPNRIWDFRHTLYNRKEILKEIIRKMNPNMIFSEWKELNEKDQTSVYDLRLKSLQVGMSLHLEEYDALQTKSKICLVRIENTTDAKLWSYLFQQSFGYFISEMIIDKIKDQVAFYNIRYDKDFAGTVATYELDNSIGVHSLGILEQFRKKGIAEIVMKMILEDAQKGGLDCVHLQSSAMGLNVYKRLGFKEIFKMYNYVLNDSLCP